MQTQKNKQFFFVCGNFNFNNFDKDNKFSLSNWNNFQTVIIDKIKRYKQGLCTLKNSIFKWHTGSAKWLYLIKGLKDKDPNLLDIYGYFSSPSPRLIYELSAADVIHPSF